MLLHRLLTDSVAWTQVKSPGRHQHSVLVANHQSRQKHKGNRRGESYGSLGALGGAGGKVDR
jgi:hypothetical protein